MEKSKQKSTDLSVSSGDSIVHNSPESPEAISSKNLDGGVKAWIQVLGAWTLFFNTWGITNSFGVFETYFTTSLELGVSPSTISWVGSSQTFLLMFIGVIAGRMLDYGYLRLQLIIGTFLVVFGTLMTSFAKQYWQILLSYGICVGTGTGFLWLPSVAVVSQYFQRRKMLAVGIAATGSSLAATIYPVLLPKLFDGIGYAWTMRVLALIMLMTLSISVVGMKSRVPPRNVPAPINVAFFRDVPYVVFIIGITCLFASVYIPFFYIKDFALTLSTSDHFQLAVLSAMNAASLIGRLFPNWIADKVGSLPVTVICCFLCAMIMFLWLVVSQPANTLAISIAYGFFSGGMVSLPPVTIAELSTTPGQYGTRMGMAYTICSFGALIGNPIAGKLLGGVAQSNDSWVDAGPSVFQGLWLFAASVMLAAACLIASVWWMKFSREHAKTSPERVSS